MFIIVWEYRVKPTREADFERIYSEDGAWAELFQKGDGYLGTELLKDPSDPQHYLTLDRWTSTTDFESFLSTWKQEYAILDAQCEGLTEEETLLGKWESISVKTR